MQKRGLRRRFSTLRSDAGSDHGAGGSCLAGSSSDARASLSGCPVAVSTSGEVLELPFVHTGQPIAERGRWAEPRVAENIGVTQGQQIRPVLVDPSAYLSSSADGPVTGDDDIDVARRALEQAQRGQVVL